MEVEGHVEEAWWCQKTFFTSYCLNLVCVPKSKY